jgi:CheY-like chemotaxis protein
MAGESGLGIGLSLARRLIAKHDGTIEARSDGPGRGSEFTIRLPLGVENLIERRTRQSQSALSMRGLRILLVEDNPDSADSLQTLFMMLGSEVATAYDGPSAVTAAERFRPDAALIDIGLPGISGHEVARQIRRLPWAKSLLLIALTGWGQQKDHELSREAGFDAHLLKPLDLGQLTTLLDKAQRDQRAPTQAA